MAKKVLINTEKLIEAALTMLLGILFLIMKQGVVSIAMTVLGVVLLVLAVLDLLDRKTLPAIIKAVFGVVVIVFGLALAQAALYVLAAILLIWGIYELYSKLKIHLRGNTVGLTVMLYLSPIMNIVLGLLLLCNQGGTLTWIFIIVGVLLIVDGALLLCDAFRTQKKKKKKK